MNRGSYLTPRRLTWISSTLSDRDKRILESFERIRFASARQLERLHFTDGTPLSNARSCRQSLASLTTRGLLARLDRRIGGRRFGSAGYLYSLGLAGQRIIDNQSGRRPREPWTPGARFMAHALDVSELYVKIREAERHQLLELLDFCAEPECWRPYSSSFGVRSTLKPDAFASLDRSGYEYAYFLEVDRSTESVATIARKLSAYRSYFHSGEEQSARGLFPKVLWLVPSERRKAVLVEQCSRLPADSWELFQVSLFDDFLAVMTGRRP